MSFTIHPESPNAQAIPLIERVFRRVEPRLRELLPELSENLQLYVYDENIIPETGTGGYAFSPTILSLAINNDFADKKRQEAALIGTIFHESYHLVQGHTGNNTQATYKSALDSAIYEGSATIFERKYAGTQPLFGNYSMHTKDELQRWRDTLASISSNDWLKNDAELWRRWSFYDTDDNQRWKAYKVGTWLTEEYLRKTGKDICELRNTPASDVYE